MKKNVLVIIFLVHFISSIGQNKKYIETENVIFQSNEIVHLFGDNVKLRANPSSTSEVLKILKINSKVTVLSEEDNTYNYNGISWKWYKVKYKNKTGYIIGGLLGLDQKTIGNSAYVISLKHQGESKELLIRLVNKNTLEYSETSFDLFNNDTFSIEAFSNKGLSTIKDVFLVDFVAEACGVDGGGCYFFNDGEELKKAIRFTRVADADAYWRYEKVIFPEDKGGIQGKLVFESEEGEMINEENNHTKIISETIQFVWKGEFLEIKSDK